MTIRGNSISMRTVTLFLSTLLLTACLQQPAQQIRVEDAWIAEIPPMIRVTAALMRLHNDGDKPVFLVGASSPNTSSIEIHRSIVVNDLAKMIQQKELEIPAQGSLEFSNDSGYHLMLYESKDIKAGNKIPISLEFKDGSVLTLEFEVKDRRQFM